MATIPDADMSGQSCFRAPYTDQAMPPVHLSAIEPMRNVCGDSEHNCGSDADVEHTAAKMPNASIIKSNPSNDFLYIGSFSR